MPGRATTSASTCILLAPGTRAAAYRECLDRVTKRVAGARLPRRAHDAMPLTVAVQMDPLETINIAGDSTFALMLSAQARGHRLFHYAAEDLNYADGRVWAQRASGDRAARRGRSFQLRRAGRPRSRRRGRRRADAAGPAVRPRLHHRDAPARADRGPDAGGQRSRERPQRAREGVRARLRAASCRRRWSPAASTRRARSWPSMARSSSSRSTATAARRSSRSAATARTCRR